MYSYEQAFQASTEYFNGNTLAAGIVVDKYLLRDNNNVLVEKTPDDKHRRLAREFARVEKSKFRDPMSEEEIFELFKRYKDVIVQGSPSFGIGNPYQYVSISNCFVIDPPEDSYGGICRADEELLQISKRRGGVGTDLDNLRPKHTPTTNSSRTSTGIVPFAGRFSNSIREVGQCIAKGQRVLTKSGLKPIEEVTVGVDSVWTKIGWVKVAGLSANGVKQTYRVTSAAGYEIATSMDHVFQTFDDKGCLTETKLGDIGIGDSIVLCLGTSDVSKEYVQLEDSGYSNINRKPDNCVLPKVLDEKLAYVLGFVYGNGYVTRHNEHGLRGLSIAVCNDYPLVKSRLQDFILEVFGYKPYVCKADGDCESIDIHNATIARFLDHNGLLKQKSLELHFPSKVTQSPSMVQAAFLAGYFDADGYASGSKNGYSFSSVSLSFLKETQKVLLSLGVVSKIHAEERAEQGWNTLYSLVVVGKSAQTKFVDLMTDSHKVQSVRHISSRDSWLTPLKASTSGVKYNNYSYCPDNSQYLSIATATRLKCAGEKVYDNLVQNAVVSVEKAESVETFDLILPEEHLFWCEGFYVHNSARRGALMITLSVHHPESVILWNEEEKGKPVVVKVDQGTFSFETTSDKYDPENIDFVTCKYDRTKVTGANISLKITDEFMRAVVNKTTYQQRWPVNSPKPSIVINVDAAKAWDKIIQSAWQMAEPGLLFWDTILRESPADCYAKFGFRTVSTNPCSEIGMNANDSCRLIAVNLFGCVVNAYQSNASFDFARFYKICSKAQRLMDDMVDLEIECIDRIIAKINSDPEPEHIRVRERDLWVKIRKTAEMGRRTGLGILALGDAMAACNIKYGTEEGIAFVDKVYKTLKFASYQTSTDMAEELGPFPIWDWELEKDNAFIARFKNDTLVLNENTIIDGTALYNRMSKVGRRNIASLTTAPTGTISNLALLVTEFGTTSGIEPMYTWKGYIRRRKINHGDQNTRVDFVDATGDSWQNYEVYPAGVTEFMKATGKKVEESPYFGHSAEEIDWTIRVRLQAAAQRHVDHAISSTVNLPNDVSVEKVKEIYETAWKSGCKGITVYRDGCRSGVLIKAENTPVPVVTNKRPKSVDCDVYHVRVSDANRKANEYFILVGIVDNRPYEVFAGKNGHIKNEIKHGKIIKVRNHYKVEFDNGETVDDIGIWVSDTEEAVTRLVSLLLQSGKTILEIVRQLEKVEGDLQSFAKGLSRALKKYIPDGTVEGEKCPTCSSELIRIEGCQTCRSCGYSKCS